MVAPVGFLRGGETGELAHGPQLAAVHVAVDAARVRELAGRGEGKTRNAVGAVDGLDGHSANGRKPGQLRVPTLSVRPARGWTDPDPHTATPVSTRARRKFRKR